MKAYVIIKQEPSSPYQEFGEVFLDKEEASQRVEELNKMDIYDHWILETEIGGT